MFYVILPKNTCRLWRSEQSDTEYATEKLSRRKDVRANVVVSTSFSYLNRG